MLTNQQITALVLGILLPMILLIGTAYARGVSKGMLDAADIKFDKGYQAGLSKQSQHIESLQGDIGTLNTRLTNMSEALANSKEGHELTREQLAQATNYCAAIQREAALMQPRVLTDSDLDHLRLAACALAGEARRFQKSGSNKVNQALVAQRGLLTLRERAISSTWLHPDTERLDWLEEHATGSGDFETFTLTFSLGDHFLGADTFRQVIDDAREYQEEQERAA